MSKKEEKVGQTEKPKAGGAPLLASVLASDSKKAGLAGVVSNKARLLKAASLVRTFVKLKGKNQSESASTHGSTVPPKYENSYRLEPERHFQVHLVKEEISQVLQQAFHKYSYDAESARELSTTVSTLIMEKVKALGFHRYKLICNVTISENSGQGVGFFSRCIWDAKNDNFATVSLEKENFYVIAIVHAVYYE